MANGLHNIILHDSYFRGKRVLIRCHDHTHNAGGNGAGKTSALRLIPVFYGYGHLEKLVSRAAGKKSFLDYYLPRKQSMIVFEYGREDGIHCVVLYRHPQNA